MNSRLLVDTRHNGLVVPASVVQRGPDGTYAYVITSNKTAEMRPVKVGQIDGGQALIDSGLQEGEQVVVDGQYKLQPGAPVQITAPVEPSKGKALTQADESPSLDQVAKGSQQSPGQNGSEHHRRPPQTPEKPEGSPPPAVATQG